MYVVFDCKNNKSLYDAIKDRLIELGYKYSNGFYNWNICFYEGCKDIYGCLDLVYAKNNTETFKFGNLDTLFSTDEYKFKEKQKDIYVGGYKAMIDGANKAVQIDNVYLTKPKIN